MPAPSGFELEKRENGEIAIFHSTRLPRCCAASLPNGYTSESRPLTTWRPNT
jgi:hypothetical protein